jgi:hypothetical protein
MPSHDPLPAICRRFRSFASPALWAGLSLAWLGSAGPAGAGDPQTQRDRAYHSADQTLRLPAHGTSRLGAGDAVAQTPTSDAPDQPTGTEEPDC